MVVAWGKVTNIIRTAVCCVVYDSCAQRYAHECVLFSYLYLAIYVKISFFYVFVKFSLYLCVFCVSLDYFDFVLSKLFLGYSFFQYRAHRLAGKNGSEITFIFASSGTYVDNRQY